MILLNTTKILINLSWFTYYNKLLVLIKIKEEDERYLEYYNSIK